MKGMGAAEQKGKSSKESNIGNPILYCLFPKNKMGIGFLRFRDGVMLARIKAIC